MLCQEYNDSRYSADKTVRRTHALTHALTDGRTYTQKSPPEIAICTGCPAGSPPQSPVEVPGNRPLRPDAPPEISTFAPIAPPELRRVHRSMASFSNFKVIIAY